MKLPFNLKSSNWKLFAFAILVVYLIFSVISSMDTLSTTTDSTNTNQTTQTVNTADDNENSENAEQPISIKSKRETKSYKDILTGTLSKLSIGWSNVIIFATLLIILGVVRKKSEDHHK